MKKLQFGGMILGLVFLFSCSRGPASLSDADAQAVIENAFASRHGFILGRIDFVTENPVPSKGQESVKEWDLYKAMAKRGVITFSKEQDLTKSFGGWDNFFALSQNGVRRRAVVSLTEKGKTAGKIEKVGNFDILSTEVSTFKIQKIVANNLEPIGTDFYRVVLGTYKLSVLPDLVEAWEAYTGEKLAPEYRIKCLLKYDLLKKDWHWVALDRGDLRIDFSTNNVDKFLNSLKQGNR